MRLTSWLASLRRSRRPARRNARSSQPTGPRLPSQVEHLEDRTLLSVTTLLIDGQLSVVSDAGEAVAIGADTLGNVQVSVDGVIDPSAGTIPA